MAQRRIGAAEAEMRRDIAQGRREPFVLLGLNKLPNFPLPFGKLLHKTESVKRGLYVGRYGTIEQ